jgi:hypothetical protein
MTFHDVGALQRYVPQQFARQSAPKWSATQIKIPAHPHGMAARIRRDEKSGAVD